MACSLWFRGLIWLTQLEGWVCYVVPSHPPSGQSPSLTPGLMVAAVQWGREMWGWPLSLLLTWLMQVHWIAVIPPFSTVRWEDWHLLPMLCDKQMRQRRENHFANCVMDWEMSIISENMSWARQQFAGLFFPPLGCFLPRPLVPLFGTDVI